MERCRTHGQLGDGQRSALELEHEGVAKSAQVAIMRNVEESSCGRRMEARRGTVQRACPKSWGKRLSALDKGVDGSWEETHENDEELHAWCILEDSEQRQEAVSKQNKRKLKIVVRISLLIEENNPVSNAKNSRH